jgi:hypothetical protein
MEVCEFCHAELGEGPSNVLLLHHIKQSPWCEIQYNQMLANLNRSWTPAMSGG